MSKLGAILFLFSALSWSQSYTGSIRGTITDNTNAAVPAAKVTATDVDRNVDYSTVTDSAGPLYLADAAGGAIQADGRGRRIRQKRRRPVPPGSPAAGDLDIALTVGSVATSVEVQDPRPLLNVTSATLGQVIENRRSQPAEQRPQSAVAGGACARHRRIDRRRELHLQRSSQQRLRGVAGRLRAQRHRTERRHHRCQVHADRRTPWRNSRCRPTSSARSSATRAARSSTWCRRAAPMSSTASATITARRRAQCQQLVFEFAQQSAGRFASELARRHDGRPGLSPQVLQREEPDVLLRRLRPLQQPERPPRARPACRRRSSSPATFRTRAWPMATWFRFTIPTARPWMPAAPACASPSRETHSARAAEYDRAGLRQFFPAPTSPGNPFTQANNWFAQGSTPSASQDRRQDRPQHFGQAALQLPLQRGLGIERRGQPHRQHLVQRQSRAFNRSQNFIMDYTRSQSPTTIFTARAGVLRVKSLRDPLSTGFDAVTNSGSRPHIPGGRRAGLPAFSAQNYRAMGAGGFAIIHRFEDVYQYSGSVTKIHRRPHRQGRRRVSQISGELLSAESAGRRFHLQPQADRVESALFELQPGRRAGVRAARLRQRRRQHRLSHRPTAGYCGTYVNDDWRISRKLTVNFGLR